MLRNHLLSYMISYFVAFSLSVHVCKCDNLLHQRSIQTIKKNSILFFCNAVLYSCMCPALATASQSGLGLQPNGLLKVCTNNEFSGCVSSQDDRPAFFMEPWTYDGSYENAKRKIIAYALNFKGASLISSADRYLQFAFSNADGSVDDTEFYFTPNDSTIQFRSNRRGSNVLSDFGLNRKRIEKIRIATDFENVPVLRNRRRKFVFIESPFDDFGPPTIMFDQAVDSLSGDAASISK